MPMEAAIVHGDRMPWRGQLDVAMRCLWRRQLDAYGGGDEIPMEVAIRYLWKRQLDAHGSGDRNAVEVAMESLLTRSKLVLAKRCRN